MIRRFLAISFVLLCAPACDESTTKFQFDVPQDTVAPDSIGGDTVAPDSSADATPTGNSWNAPGVTMPATLRNPGGVEVSRIDGVHIFGTPPAGSPCPTPLGTLGVTNNSTATATVTPTTKDLVAIAFVPPGAISVPAGDTTTIAINFDCSSTDDISTTLNVAISNGSENNDFSTPLTLDVQGAP
ncbi:MAG: hypothetical protein R3F39_14660 [Myxococcota bacterium]